MPTSEKKKATHADIVTAILRRYPTDQGAYTVLFEAPEGTGYQAGRRADALAFSMWPSRGLTIDGFEIKLTTGDWRNEAKDPAKADAFARYCDRWWIVAPTGVVPVSELPERWGLYEVNSAGAIRAKKEAPKLEPKAVPIKMWFAWMRKASKVPASTEARIRREAYQEAKKDNYYKEKADRLQSQVDQFHKATGINPLYDFETQRLTDAIKFIEDGRDYHSAMSQVRMAKTQLERSMKVLEGILSVDEVPTGP